MKKKIIFSVFLVLGCAFVLRGEVIPSEEWERFVGTKGKEIVSMDLKDAPLSTVLFAISYFTDINFLASEDVKGLKVSLKVTDVSVYRLLQSLLSLYDLEMEKVEENLFIIRKKDDEPLVTRVFYLKYAIVPGSKIIEKSKVEAKISRTEKSVSGGKVEGEGGLSGKGLFDALEAILSESGVAICDPRTNSILVKDVASNMKNVEELIKSLDKPIPQVMISVDMLDVSKSVVDQLGIDWSNPLITLSSWWRDTRFPFLGKDVSFWHTTRAPGSMSKVTVGGQGWALNFLKQSGDVRYLARPRIFTLNGEPAKISISTNEVIGVSVVYDNDHRPVSEEIERYETGVLLEVTPMVNVASREITMVVIPKLVETKPSKIGPMYRDPEERGIKTVVRVPDGATIVLGGLIRHVFNKNKTKVPLLGDVLQKVFGSEKKEVLDRELLIFITPKIWNLEELEAFQSEREDEEKRDKKLKAMESTLDLFK